jgi:hypothetical protein
VSLVSSFAALLQELSPVLTAPSFDTFVTLLTGWVFARRRTVTRMIEAADAVGQKHHSSFHRLFASAAWSRDELGLAVFRLILPWTARAGIVFLTVDDTLARKRGLKVHGAGMHYDPLISSRRKALTSWGHSWVVLAVCLRFPFLPNIYFSLPILFRLYISKQTVTKKNLNPKTYRTRAELAVEITALLCKAFPDVQFHLIGDSAYGGKSILTALPVNCDLTSKMDLRARLYEAPPVRRPGQKGRARKRGARRPTPEQMLAQSRGRRMTLKLYGRQDKVRIVETVAHAHHAPARPLRVVAVEAISGQRPTQAFFSTRHDATAVDVLTWYSSRWSLEVTNHDSKGFLGFEEPQGWTPQAVEHTAPTAMLLYSLIVLWFAQTGHRLYRPLRRPWYTTKTHASFADMLATLRDTSLRQLFSETPARGQGSRKLQRLLLMTTKLAA